MPCVQHLSNTLLALSKLGAFVASFWFGQAQLLCTHVERARMPNLLDSFCCDP
jgi:hypothetical protein